MTRWNDKAAPLYRKGVRALRRLSRRIDRWTRRFPMTTALLFALLGLVLIWMANRGPR